MKVYNSPRLHAKNSVQAQPEIKPAKQEITKETLESKIGNVKQLDEEQLYNVLVSSSVPEEVAGKFDEKFIEALEAIRRPDGYASVEDATNLALVALVEEGDLTEEEATTIKERSFRAAQLDDNHGALFDGIGSPGDNTVAIASVQEAISTAIGTIRKIFSGEIDLSKVLTGTEGVANDGNGGFLWKPASERDGNLVILLPTKLRGEVASVELYGENEELLESGDFSGDTHNGNRPHFRFDKPGAGYGSNITVRVTLTSGETVNYSIPRGAERVD